MTHAATASRPAQSRRRVRHIQQLFQLTQAELAGALGISPSTLARRPLGPRELDTLGILEGIGELACEVVPQDQVARWFERPKVALDAASPKSLLLTESGRRLVELFLTRAIDNTGL